MKKPPLQASSTHQGLRLDVRVDMCDMFIRLYTVAGKEGVVCWWCSTSPWEPMGAYGLPWEHVHSAHADPKGPAATPHVHPSITSTCDVITHAVGACQGPWLPTHP